MDLKEGLLLCFGNPLLDMIVTGDEELLTKYGLEPNGAILAEDKHKLLYDELSGFNVEYIAGGAAQNTARITQNILKKKNVVAYMGCVGQDEYSNTLENKARGDGVDVRYQYTTDQPTGTCAVILSDNGKHRSLCANLAAAQCFTIDHLKTPKSTSLIKNAQYYYITGFFLIVSPNSALEIAKEALEGDKTFIMNISAPYICTSFNQHLSPLIPYVDILFGNETEAEEFSKVYEFGTNDIKKIALAISNLPKLNNKKRLVIITQGADPVIVAQNGQIMEVEIERLPADKIIDTNGAGDAFVGGFLSQLIQGKPYDVCIKCGNWAAANVIQQSGCIFKSNEDFQC